MPLLVYKITGIAVYLAILLYIGAVASKRMKTLGDYFAGGKNMGFWSVAFSARATGESAWLLLGLTGLGATAGFGALWVVAGEVIGIGAAWLLMARRFKRLTDRYDSLTMPDYLESRFKDTGHRLRLASAGALIIFVTIYVSAQIDATGAAFESFLGWNYYVGVFVGFVVVSIYIVGGGFVAVVWSDVFQGALMGLGLVTLPIAAIVVAGGWGEVSSGLNEVDPSLLEFGFNGAQGDLWATLGLLCIGLGFMGSPQIFVRFIALRSQREIGRGAAVAIIWTLAADIGAVLTGMVGRHLLVGMEDAQSVLGQGAQDVLPLLVENVMPALLVGLYIAVVLSAIMSTVDSLLVVASSAVVRDWYQKVKAPDTSDSALVALSRKTTFALALVSLVVALGVALTVPSRTVFWFVIFGWSGISATFCPTVILSLFWSRMTGRAALAAMIVGFAGVPFFKFVGPSLPIVGSALGGLGELPPAFAASLIVAVVVSLFDTKGQVSGAAEELRDAAE